MSRILSYLAVGLLSFSLIACGKTDEEKQKDQVEAAQDDAKNMTARYNQLGQELTSAGVPNSGWSAVDLAAYESKLNNFENLGNTLRSVSGQNGVTIIGGDNADFILGRRSAIAQARQGKMSPTPEVTPLQPSTAPVLTDTEKLSEVKRINGENDRLAREIDSIGEIEPECNAQKVETLMTDVNQLKANVDHQLGLLTSIQPRDKLLDLNITILKAVQQLAQRSLAKAQHCKDKNSI